MTSISTRSPGNYQKQRNCPMNNEDKNGSGVRMEKCPVHDDKTPSLAVSGEGKATCLAGCPQDEVDAALATAK